LPRLQPRRGEIFVVFGSKEVELQRSGMSQTITFRSSGAQTFFRSIGYKYFAPYGAEIIDLWLLRVTAPFYVDRMELQ
jgi:hypothetical protein